MRKITFRAKRIYDKKWLYGNLIEDTNGNLYVVPCKFFEPDGHHLRYDDDTDQPVFIDRDTIGQYTGMRDKNGVQIYEGDIIEANNGHKGYVKFVYGQFKSFCYCHGGAGCEIYSDNARVIGNIHDNPELLEQRGG